jgi:hypothetical protein
MTPESFWIVPLKPSSTRVLGPYETLDEARRAGEKIGVAVHIMKTTMGDQPTLEIVDFLKNTLTP